MKERVQDFLDEIGYDLGYNENLLPKIEDLVIVEKYNIPVWEYMGYRSEKSFYTRTKPSALAIKEVIEKYGMLEREYWSKDDKRLTRFGKYDEE
tara:strand:- start:568 stop:849 length:282 start_codon:yes stop_codon:yes gene_type:complete